MKNIELNQAIINAVCFIGELLQHPWLEHVRLELNLSITERVSTLPLTGNVLKNRFVVVFSESCKSDRQLLDRFKFSHPFTEFQYESLVSEGIFTATITQNDDGTAILKWSIGRDENPSEIFYLINDNEIRFERELVSPFFQKNLLLLSREAPMLLGALAVRGLLSHASPFYRASVEHLGITEARKREAKAAEIAASDTASA